jgi:hypothetical protein
MACDCRASPLSTPAASFGPEIASRGIPAVLGGDRRPQAQTAPSGAQTFLSLCRCTLVRARVLADTLRTAIGGKEQHIQIWTSREAAGSFPRCPTQVCSQHGRGQSPRPRRDFCSASCIPCSCHITCEVNRNSILAWRSHLGPSSPARAGTSDSAACRRGSVAADSQRNSSRVVQTQSPSCMSLQEGQLRNARSHQTN